MADRAQLAADLGTAIMVHEQAKQRLEAARFRRYTLEHEAEQLSEADYEWVSSEAIRFANAVQEIAAS